MWTVAEDGRAVTADLGDEGVRDVEEGGEQWSPKK